MSCRHFLAAAVFAATASPTSLTAEPILDAAKSADFELLVEFLDQGVSIELANALGTPLRIAVRSGELKVLRSCWRAGQMQMRPLL